MIALLLAPAAFAGDLSATVGLARQHPTTLSPGSTGPSLGLLAGTQLGFARLELQASVAPLPADGTSQVSVDATRIEVAPMAGYRGRFVDGRVVDFGFDVAVGPSLTWTVTSIDVFDDRATAVALDPRFAASQGLWLGAGPMLVGARVNLYLPIDPQLSVVGTVGVRF